MKISDSALEHYFLYFTQEEMTFGPFSSLDDLEMFKYGFITGNQYYVELDLDHTEVHKRKLNEVE